MTRQRCNIPAQTLPPCDLDWGHSGDMHKSGGNSFFAIKYNKEHHRRQQEVALPVVESCTCGCHDGLAMHAFPCCETCPICGRDYMPLGHRRDCRNIILHWGTNDLPKSEE